MKNTKKSRLYLLICGLIVIGAGLFYAGWKKAKTSADPEELGIKYTSFGTGKKTMVVIPGLTVGYVTDNKEGLETAFSEFTDDYTVYVFDIKKDVPEGYTIAKMGEDLVKAINGLGLKKVYLYGCSMGGMQGIYIAGKYPKLVEKFAVASSLYKANETSNKVVDNWISLAKAGKGMELAENMGQLIYSEAYYETNKAAFEAMGEGMTEESLTRLGNTAQAIVDVDLTDEVSSIKCPVLVLGSEGDKVLTGKGAEEIAEVTGGELIMYGKEYPHAVYDEAPDLRTKVKAFFDK